MAREVKQPDLRQIVNFPDALRGDIPSVGRKAQRFGRALAKGILDGASELPVPLSIPIDAAEVTMDCGPFTESRNSHGWSGHPYRLNCTSKITRAMSDTLRKGGMDQDRFRSSIDSYLARYWWGAEWLLRAEDSVPRSPERRVPALRTLVSCDDAWEILAVDEMVRVRSLGDSLDERVFWSERVPGSGAGSLRERLADLALFLEHSRTDDRISMMVEAIVELCRSRPDRFSMTEKTVRREAATSCRKLPVERIEEISGFSRGGAMALVPGLEFRFPVY